MSATRGKPTRVATYVRVSKGDGSHETITPSTTRNMKVRDRDLPCSSRKFKKCRCSNA
ncbi:MAG TPA: hypothetical protein VN178_02580 [Rubrobacter sp.]|jgi:hypothetical protein|nr:hypothetical protein [Rubrobacter sp.]